MIPCLRYVRSSLIASLDRRSWRACRPPYRGQRNSDSAVNRAPRTIARFEDSDPGAIAQLIDIIGEVNEHDSRLDVTKLRYLPAFFQRHIDLEVLPQFVRI